MLKRILWKRKACWCKTSLLFKKYSSNWYYFQNIWMREKFSIKFLWKLYKNDNKWQNIRLKYKMFIEWLSQIMQQSFIWFVSKQINQTEKSCKRIQKMCLVNETDKKQTDLQKRFL
jgi:hypothetical protein